MEFQPENIYPEYDELRYDSHGFSSGDLVEYGTFGSVVGGLSTEIERFKRDGKLYYRYTSLLVMMKLLMRENYSPFLVEPEHRELGTEVTLQSL